MAVLPFGPLFAALYLAAGVPSLAAGFLASTALMALGLRWLRGTPAQAAWVCVQLYWILVWVVVHDGGLDDLAAPALLLIPLLAILLIDARAGWIGGGVVALTYLGLGALEVSGLAPTAAVYPLGIRIVLQLSALLGLTAVVCLLAVLYRRISDDALARLADEVAHHQETRAALAAAQAELVDRARREGRAETAIEVVHQMGNALNSVNLTAQQLHEFVSVPVTGRIDEALGLALAQEDPAAFWAGPRGEQLRAYLREVGRQVAQRRETMKERVAVLVEAVAELRTAIHVQHELLEDVSDPPDRPEPPPG